MKKAQGISMNVIVIAALALLVLVIVALVTTGRLGIFSRGVNDCKNQGGVCRTSCLEGETEYSGVSCPDTDEGLAQVCCLPIST